MATLVSTLGYLDAKYVAAAVLEVFDENVNYEPISGFAADSPWWVLNGDQRADLFKRARMAWCRLARKDFTWFPYSEDYVVRLYVRFGSAKHAVRKIWRREVVPKRKGER